MLSQPARTLSLDRHKLAGVSFCSGYVQITPHRGFLPGAMQALQIDSVKSGKLNSKAGLGELPQKNSTTLILLIVH